jgi:SNF2 family DNA or RNA helicase
MMKLSSETIFGIKGSKIDLYPHQATAAQYMRTVEYNIGNHSFMKGGILADDLGMGKTPTTVVLIASSPVPSTLILASPSTKYEWISHMLKTGTDITIYTIEGDKFFICSLFLDIDGVEKVKQRALDKRRGEEFIEPAILVSNYQLVTTGTKNDKLITDKIWWRIVIDEAHFLRNENDSWNKLVSLKQPMVNTINGPQRLGSRWCITGTPIHMGKSDLVSIFRYIDNRFLKGRTEREWEGELYMLVATNLFRRNKNQLTNDMKKLMRYPDSEPIFNNVIVKLEESICSKILQNLPYEMMINECQKNPDLVNSILSDELCFMIAKTTEAKAFNMKTANGSFTEPVEFRNMISYPFTCIPHFINKILPNNPKYKGSMLKIENFKKIIDFHNGESFVCFHHYENIGFQIRKTIEQFYPFYIIFQINGDVNSDNERYNIIQKANKLIDDGKSVILIASTGATAEGSNFQKFSNIIKFDPEYNQKTDMQTNARVYRIGQKNQVYIYDLALDDFMTYYGLISVDRRIQNIRDERTHLSDFIDNYNAAFSFKRYTAIDDKESRQSGVYFGDTFEQSQKGSYGGPDSIGPSFIV